MNFIETIKSVGGVKPCLKTTFGNKVCPDCHGTGQILDLAPLLAKPRELEECVKELIDKLVEPLFPNEGSGTCGKSFADEVKDVLGVKNLHIVGPQRASNLVYEVARQLGGMAVTCFGPDSETKHNLNAWANCECICPACKRDMIASTKDYRLSLPVPPDATVLFVTDRVNQEEMFAVMETTMTSAPKDKPHKFLPYLLALVSAYDKWEFPDPEETQWKIISLHKETN